jgi:hypothetical protein
MAFRHLTFEERCDREATELLREERRRTKHHHPPTRRRDRRGHLQAPASYHLDEINDWLTPDQRKRRP